MCFAICSVSGLKAVSYQGNELFSSERFYNHLSDRYHQMLLNSGYRCGKCRQRMMPHLVRGGWIWVDTFQDRVCYDCLKPFCGESNCSLHICIKCYKDCCNECAPISTCDACGADICIGCGGMAVCEDCEVAHCGKCMMTHECWRVALLANTTINCQQQQGGG